MPKERLKSLLLFYRQITSFNLLVSIFAATLVPVFYHGLKGHLFTFMWVFMTVGFVGSLYFFDLRKRHQYYFFYNIGWGRKHLYLYSYGLNLILYIPLFIYWQTL